MGKNLRETNRQRTTKNWCIKTDGKKTFINQFYVPRSRKKKHEQKKN